MSLAFSSSFLRPRAGKSAKNDNSHLPALVDAVVLIIPPPALDSKRMSQDVAEIIAIHRSASPQEVERANWDNKHEDLFAIAKVLSDKFTKEFLPKRPWRRRVLERLALVMMVPERGEAIRARAEEYAHNRVAGGDHCSADLPASKEAAQL